MEFSLRNKHTEVFISKTLLLDIKVSVLDNVLGWRHARIKEINLKKQFFGEKIHVSTQERRSDKAEFWLFCVSCQQQLFVLHSMRKIRALI